MKLYVGNLNWEVTDEDLKDTFAEVGSVVSANVIRDRDTGRSRGFGFVEYESREAGEEAITKFNGYDLKGRTVKVNEAMAKKSGGGGAGNRW